MEQRELVFRVWHKRSKFFTCWNNLEGVASIIGSLDKKDYIITQWTGLGDKNGIEIYEGDIVRVGNNKYTVVWSLSGWGWKKGNRAYTNIVSVFKQDIFKDNKVDGFVIGNIYEGLTDEQI